MQGRAVYQSSTAGRALAQAVDSRRNMESDTSVNTDYSYDLEEPLTDREIEVLQLMAYGRKNSDISNILNILLGTVKTHVHRIIQKMNVEERTQAVLLL